MDNWQGEPEDTEDEDYPAEDGDPYGYYSIEEEEVLVPIKVKQYSNIGMIVSFEKPTEELILKAMKDSHLLQKMRQVIKQAKREEREACLKEIETEQVFKNPDLNRLARRIRVRE